MNLQILLKHHNNDIEYQDLINEISVISHLRHPNLVLFLGASTITDPLLLVYEYMENGSLESYYNKHHFISTGKEYLEDEIPHVEMLFNPR